MVYVRMLLVRRSMYIREFVNDRTRMSGSRSPRSREKKTQTASREWKDRWKQGEDWCR